MILMQCSSFCCRESVFIPPLIPKWQVENSFMWSQTFSFPLYRIKKRSEILISNQYLYSDFPERFRSRGINVFEMLQSDSGEWDSHWKWAQRHMGILYCTPHRTLGCRESLFLLVWASLCFMIRAREEKAGFAIFPHNVSWRSAHNLWDTLHEMFMRNLGRDTNGSVAPVTVQARGVRADQLR